jgi:hypothetical protein
VSCVSSLVLELARVLARQAAAECHEAPASTTPALERPAS